ncbi:hypothetical protein [Haloarchaeobius sp. DFWS5]|uniref:hypothetical protein n=1 Tax=Haloarchaeobius sp. DFWS5 TaxID=3446114 RepID=UPI003EBA1068
MTPNGNHVRRIATTELRRAVRVIVGNRIQLASMGLVALMFGGLSLAAGYGFSLLGEELLAGGLTDIPIGGGVVGAARGVIGLAFVGIFVMSVVRTVAKRATVDEPASLLLASRVRDIVPAFVLAEVAGFVIWLVVPITAVVVGFAYGAQAPLVALVTPVVFLGVALPAVYLGFFVGLLVHYLITRYPPLARHRTALIALAGVAYFGLIFTGAFNDLTGALFEPMQSSPLSWYADLLLLGAPNVSVSVARIGAAVATTLVVVPLVHVASVRVADNNWFSDPARDDDEDTGPRYESDRDGSLATRLLRPLDRPTREVVRIAWIRTRRAPIKLLYLLYPLFAFIAPLQEIIQTGDVPAHVPFLLAAYVAWGTAMAFTLNPLGDDGPALPSMLTSPMTGRQFITGHVLAGAIVGVPIAVVLVGVSTAISPLVDDPPMAAAALAVGVLGSIFGPLLAAGFGIAFPRFGSVKVAGNRKAVVPSKSAMLVFSLALAAVGAAAALTFEPAIRELAALVVSLGVTFFTPWELSVAASTFRPIGIAVLALGLASPVASYVYAVRTFENYTLT